MLKKKENSNREMAVIDFTYQCIKSKAELLKTVKSISISKFRIMATYRGKKVSLNKVMRGDVKKFKVFVKKGNRVVKVNFGDKSMKIKRIFQLGKSLFSTS